MFRWVDEHGGSPGSRDKIEPRRLPLQSMQIGHATRWRQTGQEGRPFASAHVLAEPTVDEPRWQAMYVQQVVVMKEKP
jgi:hypothetical protein